MKNTIFRLHSQDKEIVGDVDILEHATGYYKNLFGHASNSSLQLEPDLWIGEEKLSAFDNLELCRPFDEEKMRYAIFQMKKK
jgi:hypothetical protein